MMTENQLRYLAHQETIRHNLATEALDRGKLDESVRSNLAKETEANRSNVARETETNRSNLVGEDLAAERNLREWIYGAPKAAKEAIDAINSAIESLPANKIREDTKDLIQMFLNIFKATK